MMTAVAEYVGGNTGAVVAWVVALATAGFAGWQTWINHRAGVSGDEVQAAEQIATERRDTIADRDALIRELRAERTELVGRLEAAEAKLARLEERLTADMSVRMVHMAWDWEALEELSRAGVRVRPAPPLRAAPTEVTGEDG